MATGWGNGACRARNSCLRGAGVRAACWPAAGGCRGSATARSSGSGGGRPRATASDANQRLIRETGGSGDDILCPSIRPWRRIPCHCGVQIHTIRSPPRRRCGWTRAAARQRCPRHRCQRLRPLCACPPAGRPGVTVIDAGRIGGGASHGNWDHHPSHAPPLAAPGTITRALKWMFTPDAPLYIPARFDPALWRWLGGFARRCNHHDWLQSARAKSALLNDSRARLCRLDRHPRPRLRNSPKAARTTSSTRSRRWTRSCEAADAARVRDRLRGDRRARLRAQEPALKPGVARRDPFLRGCPRCVPTNVAELAARCANVAARSSSIAPCVRWRPIPKACAPPPPWASCARATRGRRRPAVAAAGLGDRAALALRKAIQPAELLDHHSRAWCQASVDPAGLGVCVTAFPPQQHHGVLRLRRQPQRTPPRRARTRCAGTCTRRGPELRNAGSAGAR